ncbi:MAG: ClbS/DfsB family four-helix bundle protein [Anaerolineae bacterium]|nr:ClbS/DfsB family four-helix bundle protein [Anaerolineae bacterium]
MSDKTQIISALRTEFDQWEGILAGLSEAQITAPSLDANWSIKDVMAHLWAWQQRSIARMEAAVQHHEPVFPEWPTEFDPEAEGQPDDLNAWLYKTNREKPWSQVYAEWKAGFLHLIELGEAVPEQALLDTGKYTWLAEYPLALVLTASREHHEEHREWVLG